MLVVGNPDLVSWDLESGNISFGYTLLSGINKDWDEKSIYNFESFFGMPHGSVRAFGMVARNAPLDRRLPESCK